MDSCKAEDDYLFTTPVQNIPISQHFPCCGNNIVNVSNLHQNKHGMIMPTITYRMDDSEASLLQMPYHLQNNCYGQDLNGNLSQRSYNTINQQQLPFDTNILLVLKLKKYKQDNYAALEIAIDGLFISDVFPIKNSNTWSVRGLKYLCCSCNELFITKNSLITHVKIHQKPFCFKCFMFFLDENSLHDHLIAVVNELNTSVLTNNIIDLTSDDEYKIKEEPLVTTEKLLANIEEKCPDTFDEPKKIKTVFVKKNMKRTRKTKVIKNTHKINKFKILTSNNHIKDNHNNIDDNDSSNESLGDFTFNVPITSRFGRKIYKPKKD